MNRGKSIGHQLQWMADFTVEFQLSIIQTGRVRQPLPTGGVSWSGSGGSGAGGSPSRGEHSFGPRAARRAGEEGSRRGEAEFSPRRGEACEQWTWLEVVAVVVATASWADESTLSRLLTNRRGELSLGKWSNASKLYEKGNISFESRSMSRLRRRTSGTGTGSACKACAKDGLGKSLWGQGEQRHTFSPSADGRAPAPAS